MSSNKCFIGAQAPDFTIDVVLPDGSFAKRSLSDYKGCVVPYGTFSVDTRQHRLCLISIRSFASQMRIFFM